VANHITVSLGISTLVPSKKLNPPLFFEYAEKALAKAKELGRNRVIVYKTRKPNRYTELNKRG
jgi:PleD family two-component response regulator